MRRVTRWVRLLGLLVLVVPTLAACGDDTPTEAALDGMTRDDPLQVGTVEVTSVDEDGTEHPFRFAPEGGRLLYVYFGYTRCPDLCPTTFADFRGALAKLDPEEAARIDVAFVTVDPDRDTPEIMNGYLGHFVEGGRAVRLTDPALLESTEEAFGASSTIRTNADGAIEVSHTSVSYIVDPTGAVVVEWPFGVKSDAMAHDLRILLSNLPEES
jgi:protein SCO1